MSVKLVENRWATKVFMRKRVDALFYVGGLGPLSLLGNKFQKFRGANKLEQFSLLNPTTVAIMLI